MASAVVEKIGQRVSSVDLKMALKMGLTAAISYFAGKNTGYFLSRPDSLVSGLWCVMTALVVVQPHLGGTYQAVFYRFLGVLIGSFLGAVFTTTFGSSEVLLGIAVFFTVMACYFVNVQESYRIASLSVSVVMILHALNPTVSAWTFSFYRFIDSCLGIMIAMIVVHVLFPTQAIDKLNASVIKALNTMSKLFQMTLMTEEQRETYFEASAALLEESNELLLEARKFFDESKMELIGNDAEKEDWALILRDLDQCYEAIVNILHSYNYSMAKIFDDGLSAAVSDFSNEIGLSFQSAMRHFEKLQPLHPDSRYLTLEQAIKHLDLELLRFRSTRATRRFDLSDVENFYVFFHSLRFLGKTLMHLEEHQ